MKSAVSVQIPALCRNAGTLSTLSEGFLCLVYAAAAAELAGYLVCFRSLTGRLSFTPSIQNTDLEAVIHGFPIPNRITV